MKKTLVASAVGLFLTATLVAQPATTKKEAPKKQEADPVVMKYGKTEIRQSQFEEILKSVPAEYQSYVQGPGRRQFAEQYARVLQLSDAAEKQGVDKDPDVVSQLRLMKQQILAQALEAKIADSIKPTDAEVKAAYEAKKSTFEQVKARHILIAFEGSPAADPNKPKLTDAQAKTKAEELRKKIVAGADFAEVAKTESDDKGSGSNGGDLGTFGRGRMVPEFEGAAFDTKVGEISPVTRTQFGYHIVKVEDKISQSIDEVRPQLVEELKRDQMQKKLDALADPKAVTFSDEYFAATQAADPADMFGVGSAPADPHAGHSHEQQPAPETKPADAKPADPKSGDKKK